MVSVSFDGEVHFQLSTKAIFVNSNTESQVEIDIADDKQMLICGPFQALDRKLFNTGVLNLA
jgi:hypothetical protein